MQVRDALTELMNKYPDEELSITVIGFSLGAALATLNAMDIANGYNDGYTHLGNELQINTSNSPYLKCRWFGASAYVSSVNPESVPSSDGITTEEEIVMAGGVGEYVSAHNMDVYLHGIAGVQEGSEFRREVDHDIALVNKHLDRLKDEHGVPTNWWKGENRKKMVHNDDGHWEVITP
ncbi:hypothetical protein V6N13_065548 [Hibiscus sabdariffa]